MKLRKILIEFIGTSLFAVMLVGALIANAMLQQFERSYIGACLSCALVGYILNASFGAQLNPIVSLALTLQRRQTWGELLGRLAAQIAGSFAGVATLKFAIGEFNLSALDYGVSALGKAIEPLGGGILIVLGAICLVGPWYRRQASPLQSALGYGAAIGSTLYVLGPFCGGIGNPALHLASAVFSTRFENLWMFLGLPFVGAVLIGLFSESENSRHQ